MAEKIEIQISGDDVIVTIHNGKNEQKTIDLIGGLIQGETVSLDFRDQEILTDSEIEVMNSLHEESQGRDEIYFLEAGPYDGMEPSNALREDGLYALAFMYSYYCVYKKLNDNNRAEAIKEAIRDFILRIVPEDTFDCTTYSVEEIIGLLRENESMAFRNSLILVYKQAEVNSLDELIDKGEDTIRGAFTCCMNALRKSVEEE